MIDDAFKNNNMVQLLKIIFDMNKNYELSSFRFERTWKSFFPQFTRIQKVLLEEKVGQYLKQLFIQDIFLK